jgi:hypothetical protein
MNWNTFFRKTDKFTTSIDEPYLCAHTLLFFKPTTGLGTSVGRMMHLEPESGWLEGWHWSVTGHISHYYRQLVHWCQQVTYNFNIFLYTTTVPEGGSGMGDGVKLFFFSFFFFSNLHVQQPLKKKMSKGQ